MVKLLVHLVELLVHMVKLPVNLLQLLLEHGLEPLHAILCSLC